MMKLEEVTVCLGKFVEELKRCIWITGEKRLSVRLGVIVCSARALQ